MAILQPVKEKFKDQNPKKPQESQLITKLGELHKALPGVLQDNQNIKLTYEELRVDEFLNADAAGKIKILDELKRQYPITATQNKTLKEFLEVKDKLTRKQVGRQLPEGFHFYSFPGGDKQFNVKWIFVKSTEGFSLPKELTNILVANSKPGSVYNLFTNPKGEGEQNTNLAGVFENIKLNGNVVACGIKPLHKLSEEDYEHALKGTGRQIPIGLFLPKSKSESMAVEKDEMASKRKKSSKNENQFLMNLVSSVCINK